MLRKLTKMSFSDMVLSKYVDVSWLELDCFQVEKIVSSIGKQMSPIDEVRDINVR